MPNPGKQWPGSTIRMDVHFETELGVDVDPATITFKLFSPSRVTTTYVYGTDSEVVKTATGSYYVDVTPDEAGRWYWSWTSTGSNQAQRIEGNFVVTSSPFYDAVDTGYF